MQPIQDLVKVLVIRLRTYFSIGPTYVNVSSNSCTVEGQSMFKRSEMSFPHTLIHIGNVGNIYTYVCRKCVV